MINNNNSVDIKQPKQVYQFSTTKYQAYKDKSNMNLQDIKHKWVERDEQSQT